MPTIQLSEQEYQLIQELREKESQVAIEAEKQTKSLFVAAKYHKWLIENGRGSGFSTFINEFYYQDDDGKEMYERVAVIREAAFNFREEYRKKHANSV